MRAPTNLLVLAIFLLLGWTCAAEDQGDAAQSIAYRRFGAWAGAYPYRSYGFRCTRTAGS